MDSNENTVCISKISYKFQITIQLFVKLCMIDFPLNIKYSTNFIICIKLK